jgi:threonine/homoserine/homoserine lactone efflux protein
MPEIIFNGLKLGIVLTFLVGPVFFTIIQTSVERGFWSGVVVSLGVSVSDILYVAICYFGVVQFINNPEFQIVSGLRGWGYFNFIWTLSPLR